MVTLLYNRVRVYETVPRIGFSQSNRIPLLRRTHSIGLQLAQLEEAPTASLEALERQPTDASAVQARAHERHLLDHPAYLMLLALRPEQYKKGARCLRWGARESIGLGPQYVWRPTLL